MAFRADLEALNADLAQYLNDIRNLRHLAFGRTHYHEFRQSQTVRDLVSRSTSTLQTLQFSGSGFTMVDGKPLFTPAKNNSEANLGSLDSLHISSTSVNPEGAKAMLEVVDFTKLSEMELHHVGGAVSNLFRPLEEAFNKASASRSGIKLQKLAMNADFAHRHPEEHHGESEAVVENARFGFLSSFSELKWLEISNYGMHPQPDREPTIGMPDLVINAILKHSGLKTLKFTNWTGTANPITYLSTANLDSLITGLPELEHFHFYPYEWRMVGQRISNSCNL